MSAPAQFPIADKLKAWVRRTPWGLREIPPEGEVLWGFRLGTEDILPILVYAMPSYPEAIILQVQADLTPVQIAALDKMRRSRDEFFLGVKALLFRYQTEFLWQDGKGAVILQRLYYDGLTEDQFWRDVIKVRSAGMETLIYFHQKLGGPPLENTAGAFDLN